LGVVRLPPLPKRVVAPGPGLCIAHTGLKQERRHFISDNFVMVLVIAGQGTYIEEDTGKTHVINPGNIIQRFPQRAHAQLFEDDHNQQFFVLVPASLYVLLNERQLLNRSPVLNMGGSNIFAKYDHCFHDCLAHQHDVNYCLWRMKDLVVELHQLSLPSSVEVDNIAEAQQFLLQQVLSPLSIPAVAERFNMSYIHFRRLFKQRTGLSPGAWFIKQRVQKACQLLSSEEFTIQHISDILHYPDVYTFSKQFKKEIGIPPSAYVLHHTKKSAPNL
jgi:AraC-like DNA-binding protein